MVKREIFQILLMKKMLISELSAFITGQIILPILKGLVLSESFLKKLIQEKLFIF